MSSSNGFKDFVEFILQQIDGEPRIGPLQDDDANIVRAIMTGENVPEALTQRHAQLQGYIQTLWVAYYTAVGQGLTAAPVVPVPAPIPDPAALVPTKPDPNTGISGSVTPPVIGATGTIKPDPDTGVSGSVTMPSTPHQPRTSFLPPDEGAASYSATSAAPIKVTPLPQTGGQFDYKQQYLEYRQKYLDLKRRGQ